MSLPVLTHPDMADHRPPPGHAERPERLAAVLDALADAGLDIELQAARAATRAELERVHTPAYVARIFAAAPDSGEVRLDPDTFMSPGSLSAALHAAGAVVQAVEAVVRGDGPRAFCAVRPPGHHAEPEAAMGFCLFSSVAVGVRAARAAGVGRVAVVDFDVHHGNGTQAAFQADPEVLFASIHQMPLYPGTGSPEETGVGNIVNVAVPQDAPREVWRRLFETQLMSRVDAFAPELILVSAGFDAHRRDPLAQQRLEAEDFAWATRAVVSVADARCGGRIVSSLEGGYDLQALGQSAVAHVSALSPA